MSDLERLIEELCPDGVEYQTVQTICEISRGRVISKDDIGDNAGEFPVYSSQTENDGVLGRISTYDYSGEYLTWTTDGANAGSIFYRNGKFNITNVCGLLKADNDKVDPRYLFHILSTTANKYVSRGMGNPKLMSNAMGRIRIPIPPLDVQKKIAEILDKYTQLEAELEAQLEEELEARKKQYSYYKDSIIQELNGSDVEWKTLGEIATNIYRGSGIKREQITETGIPCVRYGEIYTTYNVWFDKCVSYTNENSIPGKKYFEYGDILFAITGESVDEIAKSCAYVGNEKCLAGGDIVVLKHNQNPKYLAYALSTTDAQRQKSKGKVKSKVVHSSVPAISEITIPIPPLTGQKRIVAILDKFDALVRDISVGLPAEVAARRKQYEYYRDKLLTFKEEAS